MFVAFTLVISINSYSQTYHEYLLTYDLVGNNVLASSDLVTNGTNIYFVGDDSKIYVVSWNDYFWDCQPLYSSQTNVGTATAIAYYDGWIYFIDSSGKIRRINVSARNSDSIVNNNVTAADGSDLVVTNNSIFYVDFQYDLLALLQWNGSSWQSVGVNSNAEPRYYSKMGANSEIVVFIGFDNYLYKIPYTTNWNSTPTTLGTTYSSSDYTDVKATSSYVFFTDRTTNKVRYYYKSGSSWTGGGLLVSSSSTTVETGSCFDSDGSSLFFVNSNNRLHRMYYNSGTSQWVDFGTLESSGVTSDDYPGVCICSDKIVFTRYDSYLSYCTTTSISNSTTKTTFGACNSTYSDEFNDASISGSLWHIYNNCTETHGTTLAVDSSDVEDQYFTNDEDNIDEIDTVLRFKAELYYQFKTSGTWHNIGYDDMYYNKGFYFLSGRIRSVNNFEHGFYETRAKLPSGDFTWPAFWLVGNDSEIDIFEHYGCSVGNGFPEAGAFYYEGGVAYRIGGDPQGRKTIHLGNTQDYHIYGLNWIDGNGSDDHIIYYYDNVPVHELTYDHFTSKEIHLNLSMARTWTVCIDCVTRPTTGGPWTYNVDYVRIWGATVTDPEPLKNGQISDNAMPSIEFTTLSIYPNPSSNEFNVVLKAKNQNGALLRVFNSTGIEVHRQELSSNNTVIPAQHFTAGVYHCIVNVNGQILRQTIIKQ